MKSGILRLGAFDNRPYKVVLPKIFTSKKPDFEKKSKKKKFFLKSKYFKKIWVFGKKNNIYVAKCSYFTKTGLFFQKVKKRGGKNDKKKKTVS